MKRRYYFDTSVFGGVFDDEFSESSIQLFEQVKRGEVVCLYSKIVIDELMNAPSDVRMIPLTLPDHGIEKLAATPMVDQLAEQYLSEKIVGVGSYEDCQHI